jgi:DNA-directed RNA polymerase subunit RPC12/RpoP
LNDGDDEAIDGEVVDEPPQLCPRCGSSEIVREKKIGAFAILSVAAFGAGIAVDQLGIAFFISVVLLLAFLLTPAYQCRECGQRFE